MREDLNLTQWILLGLLLMAVLLVYSLWNYDFSSPSPRLTHAELEDYLASRPDSLEAEALPETETVSPDTARQIILFIGDSMAQGLEIPLRQYALFNGHRLITLARQSATIVSWVGQDSTGRLRQALAENKPSYLIICLGSNELMTRGLEVYRKYLQNIVAQIGALPFVWIGPPNWRQDNGLTDLMAEVIGTDKYFASKQLQLPRAGDGIHPTVAAYQAWADTLATWIGQESAYPILLKRPETPKPDSVRVQTPLAQP
ncbi:MAG: SGNH/GDSL hydrolase family protein [Microscillaceae bacterium]|nr:SGNH/GDSL hydrolase family protein [Microscillaceae bacterium]